MTAVALRPTPLVSVTFFRFEGVLCTRPSLAAAAYFAANAATMSARLPRLLGVAAALPLSFLRRREHDETMDRRVAWACVRDVSADRVAELGSDYADRILAPRLAPVGLELLAASQAEGHTNVLLSDSVDVVLRPIARRLGISHLVCNTLEIKNGRATGRLAGTVIGGRIGQALLEDLRVAHGFDLVSSRAYAARAADRTLLGAVGHPFVVSPEGDLLRFATDLGWKVLT
jgi:phosphoserine phosphatase